jgi:hypothetical protein
VGFKNPVSVCDRGRCGYGRRDRLEGSASLAWSFVYIVVRRVFEFVVLLTLYRSKIAFGR